MAVPSVKGAAPVRRPTGVRLGFTLLLLLVSVLIPFIVFEELARDVRASGPGQSWDVPALQAIHRHATPAQDRIALWVSTAFSGWGTGFVALVVGVELLRRRRKREVQFVAASVVGANLLAAGAKLYFRRLRPELWEPIRRYTGFAFPSGHATSSLAFGLSMVLLAWPTRWRWPVLAACTVLVAAVGLSRLYLGAHYPSDVLAGWSASTMWVGSLRWLFGLRRFGERAWMR